MIDPFAPTQLGPLRLRSRIIQAATFEGLCIDGIATHRLVEHHRNLARGGVAMTTVAHAAVVASGRDHVGQLWLHDDAVPKLRELTAAVRYEGAAAAIQLDHAGYDADPTLAGGELLAPSEHRSPNRSVTARRMTEAEISRVVGQFAAAASVAVAAGFDAIELQFGHGLLISQFLSPAINRRDDRWGGSVDNRARLAIEIIRVVRSVIGSARALIVRHNIEDGFSGGLEPQESLAFASRFARENVDALLPSAGFAGKAPMFGLRGAVPTVALARARPSALSRLGTLLRTSLFVRGYRFDELYLLGHVQAIKKATGKPVVLVGGVRSRKHMTTAMQAGLDFVAMARPLVHDPGLVKRLASESLAASGCVPCNECLGVRTPEGIECPRRT